MKNCKMSACEQLNVTLWSVQLLDVWGPFLCFSSSSFFLNTKVKWESKQSGFYG